MTVLELILLAVSFLIVFSAKRKMKKENLTLSDYFLQETSLVLFIKAIFISITVAIFLDKIDGSLLNYKIF